MGVIYISTSFEEQDIKDVFSDIGKIHFAANKYNQLLCSGISENGVNVTLLSILPVTTANCKKRFVRAKKIKNDSLCKKYLSVINIPVIKNLYRATQVFFNVLFAPKGTTIVYDLYAASANMGMLPAARLRRFDRICIVTDLPEDLSSKGKRDGVFSKLINKATGYVILTKYMSEKVNPDGKKEIIIEGVSRIDEKKYNCGRNNNRIMYAGILDERYGVGDLVRSFLDCKKSGEELHLFGNGKYAEEIARIAEADSSVIYHGSKSNSEVMEWEHNVKLLVNPRTSAGSFTKYSFPSKVMEYLSTATPVLMAKLPGIPDEYYNYCYTFDDHSSDGLKIALRQVMDTPDEILFETGKKAQEFVLYEKNSKVQAKKLIDMFDIQEK